MKTFTFDELEVELIKIIPTLILGLMTFYIAYRQFVLEKQKFKHSLYQKRMGVFKIVNKLFFHLVANNKIDPSVLHEITFVAQDRFFVFSEKLNDDLTKFFLSVWEVAELQLSHKNAEAKKLARELADSQSSIESKIQKEMMINKV